CLRARGAWKAPRPRSGLSNRESTHCWIGSPPRWRVCRARSRTRRAAAGRGQPRLQPDLRRKRTQPGSASARLRRTPLRAAPRSAVRGTATGRGEVFGAAGAGGANRSRRQRGAAAPRRGQVTATTGACITVEAHGARQRLDRYLAERGKWGSRAQVQRLISDGHVRLDGQVVKPATVLRAGQRIEVHLVPQTVTEGYKPEPIPLAVLHEDDWLL